MENLNKKIFNSLNWQFRNRLRSQLDSFICWQLYGQLYWEFRNKMKYEKFK